ncbi:MAG: helix-turn-helix transcriptional regulator [Patescibacteria group bacterium]|nr:helix-turn-helix transcriptional regulator [Patescibacteria group bacterium]
MSVMNAAAKIGKYLRYQRMKRKDTLADFAQKIGVNSSYLFRLEKGDYKTVGIDVLEKIATGLQMDLVDLLLKCNLSLKKPKELPDIKYYLREKYQFHTKAIEDVLLFMSFVEKKYEKEIARRRKLHEKYWAKSKEDTQKLEK